jgi:multiple sugar transport system substrate-binding protein
MNRKPLIIAAIAGAVILVILFVFFGVGRKPAAPAPVTLEFWGFGDDDTVWTPVIDAFHAHNPGITVHYKRFVDTLYEDTLVNRLAAGTGPDVFLMKSTWLGRQRDKVAVLPPASSPLSPAQFRDTFVDGTTPLIAPDGSLAGVPLSMDSLALFYNKDVFDAAGIANPPATWDDFASVSRRLTTIASNGDILRSGAAIGAAKNVSYALEAISALIFQRKNTIVGPDGHLNLDDDKAGQAIAFYASFADRASPNFSWTGRMPESLDAFAQGTAAMAFGQSADVQRVVLKNPHLNFGVAPFPQLAGGAARTFGTYTFPAVSRVSAHPSEAWRWALYITSRDGASRYLQAAGRPPARRDLVATMPEGGISGAFSRQALIARDWIMPDESAVRRIFGDAIDGIASGAYSPLAALARIVGQLQLLLP